MAAPFRFDRTWRFDVAPDALWCAVADTGSYARWWPWLDRFDPVPVEAGATTSFRVRPPLPYTLSFTVTIAEVDAPRRLVGIVGGDVTGTATLEIVPVGCDASAARLVWELALQRADLVRFERYLRPAMVWGHDLVVAMGARQFRRRALSG